MAITNEKAIFKGTVNSFYNQVVLIWKLCQNLKCGFYFTQSFFGFYRPPNGLGLRHYTEVFQIT